jgi:ankyrin repeat protein
MSKSKKKYFYLAGTLFLFVYLIALRVSCSNKSDTLMVSAFFGETETIQALLAKGADVNAKRVADGQTVLMEAVIPYNMSNIKTIQI